jgi:hypothetical protein
MSELESGAIPLSQPFQQIGKYLRKNDLIDVTRDHFIRQSCFSMSYQRKLDKKRNRTESLEQFIESLEGFKKVRLSTASPAVTEFTYLGRDVLSITWIPPWAARVYATCGYLQLDCSFRATRPAAYCVPQAIIRNFAVPLGFIVTPTESHLTYQWFMEDLEAFLALDGGKFVKKPVLSDQGSALKKFCKLNEYKHYFYHRHLIEKWGAKGHLGMLATRVLREPSSELFQLHLPTLQADAQAMVDVHLITNDELEKFNKFLDLENKFPHGLWHRIADGVSSCSNHAERFHGVINQHLGGMKAFVQRLLIIKKQILARWREYPFPRYHFRQLKDAVAALCKCKAVQRDCHCDVCLAYRSVMNSRFGIKTFPCRHTALQWSIETVPAMPDLPLPAVERDREATVDPNRPKIVWLPPTVAPPLPDPAAAGAQGIKKAQERQVSAWTEADEVSESEAPLDSACPYDPQMDRELVIRITNWALFLRRRRKKLPPFDRDSLLLTIGGHFVKTMIFEPPLGDSRVTRFANYSAQWWAWAVSGENQPQTPVRLECE